MKMTPAWLEQTVEHLCQWGFSAVIETSERTVDGERVYGRRRTVLTRGPSESFALDVLTYADGSIQFWMELLEWHGITALPYRLDSWRHREDRVEFKYAVDPETSTGLSFVLRAPEPPRYEARGGAPWRAGTTVSHPR